MKVNRSGVIILFLVGVVVFLGTKYSEYREQVNRLTSFYQIAPPGIPSNLDFAGEKVPLDKFEIKERLDREILVNTFWQSSTMLIIKRTGKIFPVIEPILKTYGIPEDFKYLAVAESGLINATSSAGAKGVWQFMASSGEAYGLEINNNVDERYNLEASTRAACVYLKEAYTKFGSWTLAAAAYNRGMAGIRNDLTKQQVDTYYDLHLNSETARYVMRILAFKTILENPENYGFFLEDKDFYAPEKTVDIEIDSTITNISDYAQQIGTNYHVLKTLNPWIKGNELEVEEKPYIIKAPLKK
jgi:membrane-bound lytic murein transglycosylase D